MAESTSVAQTLRQRALELTLQWLAQDNNEMDTAADVIDIADVFAKYMISGTIPEKTEDE